MLTKVRQIQPRFSVVIPCHNEALYLGKTLASLGRQSFSGKFEIIVVDNNCSDNTVSIANKFGVKVITENHPGVCWARQAGTLAARGDIVISTDADTTFKKDWLENIDRTFRSQDCVAVAGPCAYSDGPWWGQVYPKLLFGAVYLGYRLTGRLFYVTATNIAFDRKSWSGYNTVLTQGGDELALLHDLDKKGRVVFNKSNYVSTSGRRLNKGLAYSLFVTFLYRYLMAYYLNKLFQRTIIGMAPAYRTATPYAKRSITGYQLAALAAVVPLSVLVHLPGHDTLYQQAHETFGAIERTLRELV